MRWMLYIPYLALTQDAVGQIVSYEGLSFPEAEGWIRSETPEPYLAERWLESGWFYQRATIVDPGPPQVGQQDFYAYPLSDFSGADSFFVEWRMQTDGTRQGFPNVSPASLVVGGRLGISYHFTLAEDQVRYIDSDSSVFFFDIAAGIPHDYRLDLSSQSFDFRIDDVVVISGPSPGAYPTIDSVIKFGARAGVGEETTRWDYIRFGVIPEPATVLLVLVGGLVVSGPHYRRRLISADSTRVARTRRWSA